MADFTWIKYINIDVTELKFLELNLGLSLKIRDRGSFGEFEPADI